MSIRDTRIETRRMPAAMRPAPSRFNAVSPAAAQAAAAARAGVPARSAERRTSAAKVGAALSVHRSEPSGLFSSAPAARDALVEGLARIEDLLDRVLARHDGGEEAATLDLGRDLVADIGRRLHLLRMGAESVCEQP